jgi:hypothetical protein
MQTETTVPPDEAARTLASVKAAREAADRRLAANWFAPVVVGALLFFSYAFFGVYDGGGVALYWLAVAPFAAFAIKRYELVQLRRSGGVRSWRPYALLAGSFIASCVVCGAAGAATGEPDIIVFGPPFGIALAYAWWAWTDRSRRFLIWSIAVAIIATGVAVLGAGDPSGVLAAVIGARLVLEGFTERNSRGA